MFGKNLGVRFGLAALGVALGSAVASAVEFNEIARFNVSFAFNADINNDGTADNPQYIGTNPLAIAWNGSKLYLAGFNQGTFPGAGIIEVLNAGSQTGLQTPTAAGFSSVISLQNPPFGRGYTGLSIKGNRLAASYDEGSASVNGIQLFDTATNTKLWDLSASSVPAGDRGGSGVAFDPGFNGSAGGQGVAWTKFGSGRRALQNASTGATIYGFAAPDTLGMQWLPAGTASNTARDIDFDPETGDMYVRRSNDLDKAVRNGDNSMTSQAILVDNTDAAASLGQKLAFMNNTVDGDLLIYNNRPNNATGVAFLDAVKVINKNGVAQTANFNLIGGQTGADIAAGAAIYDFDFDQASQTLAVADFFNRNVFIFKVGPVTPPPSGVLGDYDNNGTVGASDYSLWAANLGGASTTLFNVNPAKDGTIVDASDYTIWRDQLPVISAVAGAAVPEPAAIAIVSLVVGAGIFARRGK